MEGAIKRPDGTRRFCHIPGDFIAELLSDVPPGLGRQAELIPRQFFDIASLAQNDVLPAAISSPKKA
jgi:hypothetical protein